MKAFKKIITFLMAFFNFVMSFQSEGGNLIISFSKLRYELPTSGSWTLRLLLLIVLELSLTFFMAYTFLKANEKNSKSFRTIVGIVILISAAWTSVFNCFFFVVNYLFPSDIVLSNLSSDIGSLRFSVVLGSLFLIGFLFLSSYLFGEIVSSIEGEEIYKYWVRPYDESVMHAIMFGVFALAYIVDTSRVQSMVGGFVFLGIGVILVAFISALFD